MFNFEWIKFDPDETLSSVCLIIVGSEKEDASMTTRQRIETVVVYDALIHPLSFLLGKTGSDLLK